MLMLSELKIAAIGLGYVCLPLAVKFGKQVPVVGFDIHQKRIDELKKWSRPYRRGFAYSGSNHGR